MASVHHGSARTTPRLRAELQASKESSRPPAARYALNPKTVRKWRKRTTTADAPMGPKRPKSTVLTEAEDAIVMAFRQKTMLPLDDVLGCLRDAIPSLSRSALHRCLQRHGISRLPVEEAKSQRKRFKTYEIGYVQSTSTAASCATGSSREPASGSFRQTPPASTRMPTIWQPIVATTTLERMFRRLKDFRHIATRYDKRADNFLSAVLLAAAVTCWTTIASRP